MCPPSERCLCSQISPGGSLRFVRNTNWKTQEFKETKYRRNERIPLCGPLLSEDYVHVKDVACPDLTTGIISHPLNPTRFVALPSTGTRLTVVTETETTLRVLKVRQFFWILRLPFSVHLRGGSVYTVVTVGPTLLLPADKRTTTRSSSKDDTTGILVWKRWNSKCLYLKSFSECVGGCVWVCMLCVSAREMGIKCKNLWTET